MSASSEASQVLMVSVPVTSSSERSASVSAVVEHNEEEDETVYPKLRVLALDVDVITCGVIISREPVALVVAENPKQIIRVDLTDQENICVDSRRGQIQVWLDNAAGTSTTSRVTVKDISVGYLGVSYDVKVHSVNVMERYDADGRLMYSRDNVGYTLNSAGGCVTFRRFMIDGHVHWGIETQFVGNPRKYV